MTNERSANYKRTDFDLVVAKRGDRYFLFERSTKMPNNKIDWQPICDGYNWRTSSRLTVRQMLEHLYRHMGSIEKMAEYLGVDPVTIARKMDSLDIERKRLPARPGTIRWKLDSLSNLRFASMTNHELAMFARCSLNEIYKYKSTHRRRCKNDTRVSLDMAMARRKARRERRAIPGTKRA